MAKRSGNCFQYNDFGSSQQSASGILCRPAGPHDSPTVGSENLPRPLVPAVNPSCATVAEAILKCFGRDAGESAGGNARIVFVHDKVRQALSELRRRFEALYGERLVRMILYGSQARGDARPWSDIDVLVVLKEPVDDYQETMRTEVTVGDLCLQFDVVVICIFMSETQYLAGEGPLLRTISAEGVLV